MSGDISLLLQLPQQTNTHRSSKFRPRISQQRTTSSINRTPRRFQRRFEMQSVSDHFTWMEFVFLVKRTWPCWFLNLELNESWHEWNLNRGGRSSCRRRCLLFCWQTPANFWIMSVALQGWYDPQVRHAEVHQINMTFQLTHLWRPFENPYAAAPFASPGSKPCERMSGSKI